jgi:DNA-directed RNA polymerase specialized sigma24 family protein
MNNCSQAPQTDATRAAADAYLDSWGRDGMDWDAWVAEVELIRRAFDRLDTDTRALLAMHYVEERPLAEIGRIVGAPVGTIKWRLSNARRALDRALEVERR